jgi:SPX domain protein involved in polyphosphate accumulation
MQFGRMLSHAIYPPWKEKYIDYDKLKKLLKEGSSGAGSSVEEDEEQWTDEDEEAFVEELINVQLDKVAAFQAETLQRLRDETEQCEKKLQPLGAGQQPASGDVPKVIVEDQADKQPLSEAEKKNILNEVLKKLDSITKETNELEKYSRINYTGFRKAAKKHDRRRGQSYRVRPLLEVRLAQLPFYNEDYSPLLYRLSAMYSFVRQSLEGKDHQGLSFTDSQAGAESYISYKCKSPITYRIASN